jgi:hypothetical protein
MQANFFRQNIRFRKDGSNAWDEKVVIWRYSIFSYFFRANLAD